MRRNIYEQQENCAENTQVGKRAYNPPARTMALKY